jgi:hypothetical protein
MEVVSVRLCLPAGINTCTVPRQIRHRKLALKIVEFEVLTAVVGYNALWSIKSLPTFRRNMSLSSSKKPALKS